VVAANGDSDANEKVGRSPVGDGATFGDNPARRIVKVGFVSPTSQSTTPPILMLADEAIK